MNNSPIRLFAAGTQVHAHAFPPAGGFPILQGRLPSERKFSAEGRPFSYERSFRASISTSPPYGFLCHMGDPAGCSGMHYQP
ncbi:hypothetical protein [Parapedobacter defluvii]|uniref:hypothetical protein n=1 Tax=Parapedobacter defluvii TaxID=2045106 RepID=UPI00166C6B2B|nr:hypothetical protein [Parapedobacter defluvii]